MRNLLINSLFAMAALGVSMNVAATSSQPTNKHPNSKYNTNVQKQEDKEASNHKHAEEMNNEDAKKEGHRNVKGEGKHKHHKKSHKHRHKHHHRHHHPEGEVREAAPRVPDDNSGKKMEMDEYHQ